MMCYRDMTFCRARCAVVDCQRRLSPEVERAAREWWGDEGEPPIATADYSAVCEDFEPDDGGEENDCAAA